jgi:hypothetical protein
MSTPDIFIDDDNDDIEVIEEVPFEEQHLIDLLDEEE